MEKKAGQFGPPVIAPGVPKEALPHDPLAAKYRQGIQARQTRAMPQYSTPVGGGQPPLIPKLDEPPSGEGLTMADHAAAQLRARMGEPQGEPGQNPFLAMQRGILPADVLPEEAKQDPAFQQGIGSMLAQAQPMLAFKYGVIRNGRRLAPQELGTGKKGLSQATLSGLKDLQEAQQKQSQADPGVAKHMDSVAMQAEADAAAGPAGAAAKMGTTIEERDKADTERKKALDSIDEFDWQRLREAMQKDLLNNEEQRKIIEARLEPMDIADIIMHGRVRQLVPIHPSKLEYEFQSYTGEEDLAIKRLLVKELKTLDVGDEYIKDKFGMMAACVGLLKINTVPLPTHLGADGFDDAKFWEKFNFFIKQNFHMLASISVNYFWFDVRVRQLFVAEKVKNG